jgi:hypothetical protein
METKEVTYVKNDKVLYRAVVEEETAIDRLRRSNARLAAINAVGEDGDTKILHVIFYPDCIAATAEWAGGRKPTFEEFCKLPGQFVDDWAGAVWELNPGWRPQSPTPEPGSNLPIDPAVVAAVAAAHEEDVKKALS